MDCEKEQDLVFRIVDSRTAARMERAKKSKAVEEMRTLQMSESGTDSLTLPFAPSLPFAVPVCVERTALSQ